MEASRWDATIEAFYDSEFDESDPGGTVTRIRAFLANAPAEAAALVSFELAGVYDSLGLEDQAVPLYRRALTVGLDEDHASQARIQLASTLRNLGRVNESLELLASPVVSPLEPARRAFLALTLHTAGRPDEALRQAIEGIIPALPRYQRSMMAYAAALTDGVSTHPGESDTTQRPSPSQAS